MYSQDVVDFLVERVESQGDLGELIVDFYEFRHVPHVFPLKSTLSGTALKVYYCQLMAIENYLNVKGPIYVCPLWRYGKNEQKQNLDRTLGSTHHCPMQHRSSRHASLRHNLNNPGHDNHDHAVHAIDRDFRHARNGPRVA